MMGKNNKARRAAKVRQRAQQGRGAPGRGAPGSTYDGTPGGPSRAHGPGQSASRRATMLWDEGVHLPTERRGRLGAIADGLAGLPEAVVDALGEEVLLHLPGQLWRGGWQPLELRREARRRTSALVGRLADLVILVDHDHRPGQRMDPRWASQLHDLGQREISTRGRSWLQTWRAAEGIDRVACYRAVLELAAVWYAVPALDVLLPPPGADQRVVTLGAPLRAAGNQPMLERVRKLLAKAESTTFEEEAEALTAKAQALMTRHAIDEALVLEGAPADVPRMMRVPVDAPYADAKSVLLSTVAGANRCQAVYHSYLALSSVVGHDEDLAVVDLLFASLLVQAQRGLSHAARAGAGSRARSQSFRASFYLAYAARIGERLDGVNEDLYAEGVAGSALPVLRAKEDAVADFVESHYGGRLTTAGVRGGYDLAGQIAGREAADGARLDSGALTSR